MERTTKIGNPLLPLRAPVTKHRRNIDGSDNRNNHNRARARANLNMNPSANNVIARVGGGVAGGVYTCRISPTDRLLPGYLLTVRDC